MKLIMQFVGFAALFVTLAAPLLYVLGSIEIAPAQWAMLVGTIAWFATAAGAAFARPGSVS